MFFIGILNNHVFVVLIKQMLILYGVDKEGGRKELAFNKISFTLELSNSAFNLRGKVAYFMWVLHHHLIKGYFKTKICTRNSTRQECEKFKNSRIHTSNYILVLQHNFKPLDIIFGSCKLCAHTDLSNILAFATIFQDCVPQLYEWNIWLLCGILWGGGLHRYLEI